MSTFQLAPRASQRTVTQHPVPATNGSFKKAASATQEPGALQINTERDASERNSAPTATTAKLTKTTSVSELSQYPPALEPLAPYLRDRSVTDLFINGAAGLFIDRGSGAQLEPTWGADEAQVRDLAIELVSLGGRHLDDANPCVDVRLAGGMRLHAVLPPVASDGTMISLRIPRLGTLSLDRLSRRGTCTPSQRERLAEAISQRQNFLISGGTGSGKTTLLAAMLAEVPQHERIVTVEDVAELQITHQHHVRMEARQANLEGAGGIGLDTLVRQSLRMRPDRLVVGECRGAEIRELLSALNTGHSGGGGTVHANGLEQLAARLEALGAMADWSAESLARQVCSAIELVIHLDRDEDGQRRIADFGRPTIQNDRLQIVPESRA